MKGTCERICTPQHRDGGSNTAPQSQKRRRQSHRLHVRVGRLLSQFYLIFHLKTFVELSEAGDMYVSHRTFLPCVTLGVLSRNHLIHILMFSDLK